MLLQLPTSATMPDDGGEISHCRRGWCDGCRSWLRFVIIVCLTTLTGQSIAEAQVQSRVIDQRREYNVKAVSLFAFGRFTTWPQHSFSGPQDAIVIGVYGASPIKAPLLQIAGKKTIDNRRLKVVQLSTPEEAVKCHLVFVSDSVPGQDQQAVIQSTKTLPVLVVGESPGFGSSGGVANFFISNANVKFELNKVAAQARGLKLNAKLLSLGVEVKPAAQQNAINVQKVVR